MAIFDYKCTKCGLVDEYLVSNTEEEIILCRLCNELTERLMSGNVSFRFKGKGFYANDYKGK